MGDESMDIVVNPKINKSELSRFFTEMEQQADAEEVASFKKGLKKSYVIAAYEDKKLIGFVKAVSDYATLVYIQDLLVLPSYQHLRVNKILMHHLLNYFGTIEQVVVSPLIKADAKFYRQLGFSAGVEQGLETYFVDRRAR